jgi:phosphatidylglycerol lysyltransferase
VSTREQSLGPQHKRRVFGRFWRSLRYRADAQQQAQADYCYLPHPDDSIANNLALLRHRDTRHYGRVNDDTQSLAHVLHLLKRHAAQPTSFQILEPGYHYWFHASGDACVAYTKALGARITVGEPIAPADAMPEVVQAFMADAERAGRRVRFFHVSEDFVTRTGLAATHVGEQPEWDPSAWDHTLKSSRSLREQLRRARAKGVTTRNLAVADLIEGSPERLRLDALIKRWLAARRMHELKFMVLVHPFSFPDERRYVIAERAGELVGLAVAVPVYARQGWFVEDLLRDPHAPNGTAELLVDAMLRAFAAEGVRYATLGLSPLTGDDVSPLLAFTRDTTARLYNFGGVRAFKEKLQPQAWQPVYLAYARHELGPRALRDVLAAFAPGGLVRFGLNTLIHQRTLATGLLAILLMPWTVTIALIDTGKWFPSASVQYAWTAFDVGLIALLVALVRRWRPRLAVLAMWLTTLDALLTILQALWWNVFTAQSVLEWAFVAVGCTGPFLAALFFWTTRVVSLRTRLSIARAEQSNDSARG